MDFNYETQADLHRTISTAFMDAFEQAPVTEWQRVATLIRSGNASNLYTFLNAMDGMREWLGDAVFDQIGSGRYSIANRKFQKGVSLNRDQIVDNVDGGVGSASSVARMHASACASHPDELVMGEALAQGETELCHNGQPYFDETHPNQNGDGGTQSNLITGGGTPWYIMDTSKPLKPLIYQLRETLTIDRQNSIEASDHTFETHEFRWNAWMRDAAGYGPFWLAVKSYAALDEAGFVAGRALLENMHMGVKDPLTGSYRSARNRARLLVVPKSLRDTAYKLIGQERLASGETNYLRNAVEIMVSDYL